MTKAFVLDDNDNVATLITDGKAGDECELRGAQTGHVSLRTDVPFGHKIALVSMERGENVRKYGQVIGRITEDVAKGEYVHVHNLEPIRGRGDLASPSDS